MEISIISIGYNVSPYIRGLIDSVFRQNFLNWELIYVDDGSTDDSVEIVKSYGDPRIRVIEHDHCANLSILRNTGARAAEGKYLAFVDGDDILMDNKLASQLALFNKNPNVHWSHTNAMTLLDETREIQPRKIPLPTTLKEFTPWPEALRMLLSGNFVYISSFMIRRCVFEAIGGFDEQYQYCEDKEIYLRLCVNQYNMGFVSDYGLTYRVRGNSLFRTKTLNYLSTNSLVYFNLLAKYPAILAPYRRVINKYFAVNYKKIAIQQVVNNIDGWRSAFIKSFFYYPSWKSLQWLLVSRLSRSTVARIIIDRTNSIG